MVASATFILMVAIAPRGLDKLALQVLPALFRQGEKRAVREFLVFATWRTLRTCVAVAGVVASWGYFVHGSSTSTGLAILANCMALPAGAMAHLALETLTAAGRPVLAAAIVRMGVPLMALALASTLFALHSGSVSAVMLITCWGLAWIAALVATATRVASLAPATQTVAGWLADQGAPSTWGAEARPFWIYRILIAVLAQCGVIALDWLQASPETVGAYAAASTITGLGLVLATATNRVYASQLSMQLARHDYDGVRKLRRQRLRWLAGPLAIYLVFTMAFAPQILGIFRPTFAQNAWALRILAGTVAFSVLFSLAPTCLKYRRREGALYWTVVIAALALVALLTVLVPRLGATGAAIAYAISMIGMYANFARLAKTELIILRRDRLAA